MAAPDRKISQLDPVGTPARTNTYTALDQLGKNVRGLVSSWLSLVLDTDLTFSDVTTGDVGSAAHGYTPKAPNNVGKLLRGDATWANIPYLNYQDQKTQNTQGGTFTSGAWRTRILNTEVTDTDGLGVLASNQVILVAGTYRIAASAPAYLVGRHQLRLQNVTDGTTLVTGQANYTPSISANSMVIYANLIGTFTVAAGKALELQHQAQVTESTDGFGVASNFTTEVYAIVELWRIG